MPIHKRQKLETVKFITVVINGRQSLQKPWYSFSPEVQNATDLHHPKHQLMIVSTAGAHNSAGLRVQGLSAGAVEQCRLHSCMHRLDHRHLRSAFHLGAVSDISPARSPCLQSHLS